MVYRNRLEAGRKLAETLVSQVARPCVVAALPRGGIVTANPIARALGAPLTLLYARKLAPRFAHELAFGAIDEEGEVSVDGAMFVHLRLGPADLAEAEKRARAEMGRQRELYGAPPLASYLPGAGVVLVDDGLATGLTMVAAVRYARRHGAREITVAVPCASAEAVERVGRVCDRLVCPTVDEDFAAVGDYYYDFSPVSDEEVAGILARPVYSGS